MEGVSVAGVLERGFICKVLLWYFLGINQTVAGLGVKEDPLGTVELEIQFFVRSLREGGSNKVLCGESSNESLLATAVSLTLDDFNLLRNAPQVHYYGPSVLLLRDDAAWHSERVT